MPKTKTIKTAAGPAEDMNAILPKARPEVPGSGEPVAPRQGTKQALIVGLLSKPEGATLQAMVEVTGWLPHTTRAALTGLRKRGFAIERQAGSDRVSVYIIPVATTPDPVAPKKRGSARRRASSEVEAAASA